MKIEENILKNDERAAFALRSLYRRYGYTQYKMSKFEEYDLYARNKDFLQSDGMITFTDTNGRLLALKPDVTLSIINNSHLNDGEVLKLYYDENVYRISKSSKTYKEIKQTGLECVGNVGIYEVCEVLMLAQKSLETISPNYILELSHAGITEKIIGRMTDSEEMKGKILSCICSKNGGELEKLCRAGGMDERAIGQLKTFTENYKSNDEALAALKEICRDGEEKKDYEELEQLCKCFDEKNVCIDFSVANDMSYYSGVVFKGYVKGLPTGVLSGGRYDKLMKKMGRTTGAVGFAVYLDVLERMGLKEKTYDVDTVLIRSEDVKATLKTASELSEDGRTVLVCDKVPEKLKYRMVIKMTKDGVQI